MATGCRAARAEQANGSATYAWPFGVSTGVAVRHGRGTASTMPRTRRGWPATRWSICAPRLALTKTLTLFARAENLFDEHYETAYRYGALGRSGLFGREGAAVRHRGMTRKSGTATGAVAA